MFMFMRKETRGRPRKYSEAEAKLIKEQMIALRHLKRALNHLDKALIHFGGIKSKINFVENILKK